MNTRLAQFVTLIGLSLALSAVQAADITPSTPTAPDKLASVRVHTKAKQWPAAIDELKRINDPASADWNNLMGYSLRKGPTPDLAGAERFYDEALRIDPKHRGALEYSGELFLMQGNLAKAEQRLATLDRLCVFGCEEYTDLKNAVARFKAAGNKHVASW